MRPLQCVDPGDAVAIGSLSDHPDRRFRQAPPLRRLWKSERACNPQTSTAANSVADHEALITCASQLSEGFIKKNAGINRNLHSADDPVRKRTSRCGDALFVPCKLKFAIHGKFSSPVAVSGRAPTPRDFQFRSFYLNSKSAADGMQSKLSSPYQKASASYVRASSVTPTSIFGHQFGE